MCVYVYLCLLMLVWNVWWYGVLKVWIFLQVPGALCLLQEVGESEVVLQVGESLLRERLGKSFKQDVVLAMALAYVDFSRDAMALSPPDYVKGCECLKRALKLLQVWFFESL